MFDLKAEQRLVSRRLERKVKDGPIYSSAESTIISRDDDQYWTIGPETGRVGGWRADSSS